MKITTALGGLAAAAALAASSGAFAQAAPGRMSVAGTVVNVSDFDRSLKFYTEVVGLKLAMTIPAKGPPRELMLTPSGKLGLGQGSFFVLTKYADNPFKPAMTGYGRFVLNATNAGVIVGRAKAAGVDVRKLDVGGPTGPNVYFLKDPDGYTVEIYEVPESRIPVG